MEDQIIDGVAVVISRKHRPSHPLITVKYLQTAMQEIDRREIYIFDASA